MKKISVILTVKNEEKGLEFLMNSLIAQSLKPAEIVVVDGGSTDNTLKNLKKWKTKFKKEKIELQIIKEKGNIAHGRNTAIKKAKYQTIASIDGGCIAGVNWLRNMAEKKADVVAGNFLPLATTMSEKIQAVFVKRSTSKNPSSRSIMFKKKCWKKVGGYPENLYTGEDTLFNARMEQAGFTFKKADDAIVYWKMRSSLKKWFKQYYLYGFGDGKAGLQLDTTYGKKIAFLLIGFYSLIFCSVIFPSTIIVPFITGGFFGLLKTFSLVGLFAGLLLPFRYISYIIGVHSGFIKNLK